MSGGAAWYDITAAFGMSPAKAKPPMSEERAALIIQKAYKKWLVRWIMRAPEKDLTSFFLRACLVFRRKCSSIGVVPKLSCVLSHSLPSPSSAAHHPALPLSSAIYR